MQNFTLKWLEKHINFKKKPIIELLKEIDKIINAKGMEIEEIKLINPLLQVKIEKVEKKEKVKVAICQTSINTELLQYLSYEHNTFQVLCGATNAKEGMFTVLAPLGTNLGNFTITHRQIQKLDSFGMFCAAEEIGNLVPMEKTEGIIELREKTDDFFYLEDVFFKVSTPTNRWDLMSVRGIARELALAGLGTLKELTLKTGNKEFKTPIENNVDRIVSFVSVNNIVVSEEIEILMKRINDYSNNQLKNLNDFVLKDIGHPIHIYDADFVKSISLKRATPDVLFKTLKKDFKCKGNEIIVCTNDSAACVGGIIGIEGFKENTKNVIIEAGYFHPEDISELCSDASKLFNVGVDFQQETLAYVCSLIDGDMSKIKYTEGKNIEKQEIILTYSDFFKYTGVAISMEKMKEILLSYGFSVEISHQKRDDSINEEFILKIISPSWRTDIVIFEDIIEEIMRIYGCEELTKVKVDKLDKTLIFHDQKEDIRSVLREFTEFYTFPFASKGEVLLQNSLNVDFSYMRSDLKESLMNVAIETINNNKIEHLRIYEIGKIYPSEEEVLGILIYGKIPKTWKTPACDLDFYYLQNIVFTLMEKSQLQNTNNNLIENIPITHGLKNLNFYFAQIKIKDIKIQHYPMISYEDFFIKTNDFVNIANTIEGYNYYVFDRYEKDGITNFGIRIYNPSREIIEKIHNRL